VITARIGRKGIRRSDIHQQQRTLLAHAFGTTPEFWLNLQSRYELDVAKRRVSTATIERADTVRNKLSAA
jgi:plasmid maintenance system antidote protein VapI